MSKKLIISLVVGSLISALTLYFSFRNVPLAQLAAYLKTINYWWIVPMTALVIATFCLRTLRWQLILGDIDRIKFWQAFHPLMIGFMINCVLPGRVGELARPVLLRQKRGVSVTTGIATVAAERIFDIAALILLFAFVFTRVADRPDLVGDYFGFHLDSELLKSAAWGMIRLSAAISAFIMLLMISTTRRLLKTSIEKTGGYLSARIPRFHSKILRITEFMTRIIDNFAAGLSLVRNPLNLIACAGLTLLIWGLTALIYLVCAKGCPGVELSYLELTTVMVVICFAIALPSVPGFWGLWEAAGVFALSIFGVAEKDALGYTLVNHAAQIFPVIAIGFVSALITSVNILNLTLADGGARKRAPTRCEGV